MSEYLVSGYYGDKNAGDEAILAGLIKSIRRLDPSAAFTVISKKAAWTRSVHGVAAVSRNDFRGTWRAVAKADLLLSGGGSLLQDVTSSKSLVYYLGVITAGILRRKPVMAYAQGMGPVVRPPGRLLVPAVLNGVSLISVRDPESAQTLKRLGVVRPQVHVTADPALALGAADPGLGAVLLREAGVEVRRPLVGVSVRPWRREGGEWEDALAAALDRVAAQTGAQILFLPMQAQHDVPAARAVAGRMQHPADVLAGEFTHDQVLAMVARCNLLIGMRYHALLFAAMNGVPLVGLTYDPKNENLLRALGESPAGSTLRLEAEAVYQAAIDALEHEGAVRARLRSRIAELTPLAFRNAELAVQLLDRRRPRGVDA